MATPRYRSYFFVKTNVMRDDGTQGGIRFRKYDKPTQVVYEDLFSSLTFKKETGDRARVFNDNPVTALENEQGLVVLATDAQAKTNAVQLEDRSLVVQPHQLPTVVATNIAPVDED